MFFSKKSFQQRSFPVPVVDATSKKGYLAEAVTQRCFCKKKCCEIFGKTHRKTPVQGSIFSLQKWNFIKKETPACFPIKLSEYLFYRTPVNSLATLTTILNFLENIWNFGAWSNPKKYLEQITRESCFPKIFFLWMDRIFKTGLLSLEWHPGLLALNIIPIFFKNNAMQKTKTRSK